MDGFNNREILGCIGPDNSFNCPSDCEGPVVIEVKLFDTVIDDLHDEPTKILSDSKTYVHCGRLITTEEIESM